MKIPAKLIINNTYSKNPYIHSYANPVTANDCANIILACGGSPIMSNNIKEAEEITSNSDGLVINTGMINDSVLKAMLVSGKKANEIKIPIILDPVGIGSSKYRKECISKLLNNIKFSVIKGNFTEIKTLAHSNNTSKGIDTDFKDTPSEDNMEYYLDLAKKISGDLSCIIIATGVYDIVADGRSACIIKNGHYAMSKVIGTGCMLSNVIGTICSANKENLFGALVTAAAAFGYCGELAYNKIPVGHFAGYTYKMNFIDYLYDLKNLDVAGGINLEFK